MIPVRILGTGSVLDGRRVSTAELAAQVRSRDPAAIEARTGIAQRLWLDPEQSMAALAAAALTRALAVAELPASALRRVIFVSSTGGDVLCPATANEVIERLGIADHCDCFDLNNACTGFLTAFDIAARAIATGGGPVGIATVEMLSPYLAPEVARSYFVFGDAAAAVVLGPGRPGEGIHGAFFGNNGAYRDSIALEHPGRTGRPARFHFGSSNDEITGVVLKALRRCADEALAQAGLAMDDVAWFVPHQPNGIMLKIILARLKIPPEKTVPIVDEIGSVGAASIPVALDRLLRTRRVEPGDRILMLAVGGGLSYGALLLQAGPQIAS
ncbi:MAG: ketoacyl-ACP synthase III [Myxococcales bacterium]|nr:ketoacyl-ACP synthase III [Myxococcales bacterium]